MKKNKKIIFIIVILLLVAFVGLNSYEKYTEPKYSYHFSSSNFLTAAVISSSKLSSKLSLQSNLGAQQLKNCWRYSSSSTCQNANCSWSTEGSFSWCEDTDCATADGTNQSFCEAANVTYNLDHACIWSAGSSLCNPAGGDFFGNGCSDFNNNQQDCYNTFFCVWNATGSKCQEPSGGFGSGGAGSTNPGCGVVTDAVTCTNISGCSWSTNSCSGNPEGIACMDLNQTICNSITFLSTCCSWNGTGCATSFNQQCYSSIPTLPTGATFCEDYNSFKNRTLCEQISGSPWYLPCIFNSTENSECHFNSAAFGGFSTFDEIGSELGCEAQGGVWKTEQWTVSGTSSGTVSTDNWCEFNFGAGGNCDSGCWACEKDSDVVSLATAESVCENSALGYCEFKSGSNAPNGYGWCSPKQEFIQGGGKNCEDECSACDYLNNPEQECTDSLARCVWVNDSSAQNGVGNCYGKSEKRCANDCFSCYTQNDCAASGKGGNGACNWDSATFICQPAGFTGEICFDGKDNDNDLKIDCLDSDCATDKFCGSGELGNSFGDCPSFSFQGRATCNANGCVWINETFGGGQTGGHCDFPGSQCFRFNKDYLGCEAMPGCNYIYADDSANVVRIVNVKRSPFNALGDGITDDSSAIQLALNNVSVAESLGGRVYIPEGTYLINKTLVVSNNTEIYGDGARTILVRSNFSSPYNDFIYNVDCSLNGTYGGKTIFWNSRYNCGNENIYLHDFVINGSQITGASGGNPNAPMIGFSAVKDTRIENLHLKSAPQDGIFIRNGGVNTLVRNNIIDGFNMVWNNGGGINFEMWYDGNFPTAAGQPAIVENNTIVARSLVQINEIIGIAATNHIKNGIPSEVPRVIIRNNTINLTDNHTGIVCHGCKESTIEWNVMTSYETGSTLSGSFTGIDSENANDSVAIKFNLVTGNGGGNDGRGILLSGNNFSTNATIENNTVLNKNVTANAATIEIRWFNGFQVINNTITYNDAIKSHGLAIGAANCAETRTTLNGTVIGNTINLPNILSTWKPLVSRKTRGNVTYSNNNANVTVIC